MDFTTRDRYRHAVEELARGCGASELKVAAARYQWPLRKIRSMIRTGKHVGYYLIDDGRPRLASQLACREAMMHRMLQWVYRNHTSAYISSIILVTIASVSAILAAGILPETMPR